MAQTSDVAASSLLGPVQGVLEEPGEGADRVLAMLACLAERRAAGQPSAIGRLAAELLEEHVRHGRAVASIISRDADRETMLQVQADFYRTSLDRMSRLALCCAELLRDAAAREEAQPCYAGTASSALAPMRR